MNLIVGFNAWMLLLRSHPTGLNQQLTRMSFAVQLVMRCLLKQNKLGLIGDRLCLPKTTAANGKNSIIVNAVLLGGHGAAIALPQI